MSHLNHLTQINTQDLLNAFGLQNLTYGRRLVEPLFRWRARNFAQFLLDYDRRVGKAGLAAGAKFCLQHYDVPVEALGVEHIPTEGPLLILANHPGLSDTLAFFAHIPRPDLRIIGLRRPFLEALPETARYIIFMAQDNAEPHTTMQQAITHLKAGGAILTFPAGKIEPDPAFMPGVRESFETWTESVAMFAHLSTAPYFVPALVSGVLSPSAQRNPLTRIRRAKVDREWLGAVIQLLFPTYYRSHVRVQFGPTIPAAVLRNQGTPNDMLKFIQNRMIALLEQL